MTVAVVIPTIPPRREMLERALRSVKAQTLKPDQIVVSVDRNGKGAASTRNKALARARTNWVAFLDDDDELDPGHLAELLSVADDFDVVYPDCRRVRPDGQILGSIARPFNARTLRWHNFIPVTALVRTELAKAVGGFQYPPGSKFEDWGLWLKMLDAGARFRHHPVTTWTYHLHGANTGGLPE